MEELNQKIDELTKKIEFLEKQEKKRIRKRNIEIALKITKYTVIAIIILTIYTKFNNNFIKPTKEKIDYVEEKLSSVDGKIDKIGDTIKDKWESIKDLNPFKKN